MMQQNATVFRKGSQKFDKLMGEPSVFQSKSKSKNGFKKGRSAELINTRNKCILYRYYYYSKILRLNYEDVLAAVCAEFFISTRRLIFIIDECYDEAREIFKEERPLKKLKEMYTFLNWNN